MRHEFTWLLFLLLAISFLSINNQKSSFVNNNNTKQEVEFGVQFEETISINSCELKWKLFMWIVTEEENQEKHEEETEEAGAHMREK